MTDETVIGTPPPPGYDPLRDFPGQEGQRHTEDTLPKSSHFVLFWERISQAGLIEPALRVGTILFSLALVLIVVWLMRSYLSEVSAGNVSPGREAVFAAPLPTPTQEPGHTELPRYASPANAVVDGIIRLASLRTTIPTRPRVDVITYTVDAGDTIFGIAERFSLKPETVLWANTRILRDNPHRLQVGQMLNILPVDGTYHKWSAGESLQKVAEFYGVDVMAIVEWPGNPFDLYEVDIENPDISPGTMLIVPGGTREMVDYGPPRIPRDNPAVARTYGPGHCGVLTEGIVGDGVFMWPAPEHWLSGYDYSPETNHNGIDIAGDMGDPIWAVDDGVVVYAGWSYSGYGNLVVIDHGNGWQSLYAHLETIFVSCGESVYQGATVAAMGSTGNSSGAHLHFELLYGTVKVNPWNFLP